MRVLLSKHEPYEPYEPHEPHGPYGDVDPMLRLMVRLRALQARGAEVLVCAPPVVAELWDRVGVPLVAGSVMPAMPAGGWR